MKKKILRLIEKKNKRPLVCLTAYSKSITKIIDKYCDIILVGDSLATVVYGMKNTHNIKINTIIDHAIVVKNNIEKALCVVDMPKNTYRNKKEAIKNAKLIITKSKCDAVKIECNGNNYEIIKNLVLNKIPVMGHIGFTPQYFNKFRMQGTSKKEQNKLISQAINIEKAGAFSIVLECINLKLAQKITNTLKIPTIGIGASAQCDGQILVTDDMLGLSGFYPRFVKKYAKLDKIIEKSVQKYKNDVLNKKFPGIKNIY